jgi:bifunctional Delta-12/omega-3 fatty acid desaturase
MLSCSRPNEVPLTSDQTVQGKRQPVTVGDLKKAIPAHCFQLSYFTGLFYFARDLIIIGGFGYVAWNYIPYIRYEGRLEFELLRYSAWLVYGYVQGLVFTGIWVRMIQNPACIPI